MLLSVRRTSVREPRDRSYTLGDFFDSHPSFDDVYQRYVDFVWRSVRRAGVEEGAVDDVVQQVFLVVHRRLPEFSHASSVRTWIFGIMLRVLREHRRSLRRKSPHGAFPQTD